MNNKRFFSFECFIFLSVACAHLAFLWCMASVASQLHVTFDKPTTYNMFIVSVTDVSVSEKITAQNVAGETEQEMLQELKTTEIQEDLTPTNLFENKALVSPPSKLKPSNLDHTKPLTRIPGESLKQEVNADIKLNQNLAQLSDLSSDNIKNAENTHSFEQNAGSLSTSSHNSVKNDDNFTLPSSRASYLNNPQPRYPELSLRKREQGRVLLYVLVSAQGSAKKVELRRSSGYSQLDQAALKTVRQWHFVPAKRNGIPIEMGYEVPIDFVLR